MASDVRTGKKCRYGALVAVVEVGIVFACMPLCAVVRAAAPRGWFWGLWVRHETMASVAAPKGSLALHRLPSAHLEADCVVHVPYVDSDSIVRASKCVVDECLEAVVRELIARGYCEFQAK